MRERAKLKPFLTAPLPAELPSYADAPFHIPAAITHVLDLPYPPSVNRIWRSNKTGKAVVSLSPAYRDWIKQADALILSMGGMRGRKTIYGHFKALIELKRHAINHDLDNRVKVVLDYAQRLGLVVDDCNLMEFTARWSSVAVTGCRLHLWECS